MQRANCKMSPKGKTTSPSRKKGAEGFDFVIDALHFARGDRQRDMGDNSFEVRIQQLGEPTEVAVIRGVTGVNDCGYLLSHTNFAITFVGIDQHFLDQVRGKQQTVRPQQHLISLLITALRGHGVNREQRTGRTYDHQVPLIVCLINSLQHRFVKLFERIFLNFYLEFSCFKITS